MTAENSGYYAAFKAKDVRFDGRFFVGVASTGIYCRPICRAKLPKPANCTFFAAAAAAEQAGFRPCLLCRPELAPGASHIEATATLAEKAADVLRENCGSNQSLQALSQKLGCTDRHLRRIFADRYHVSPTQYMQTCKLLLAKSLLTDTSLSVLDVAMASGFGSLRQFNALFKKQYRLTPTALRKESAGGRQAQTAVTVYLGYRAPYPWQQMLDFLSARAIPGIESVSNSAYSRTVRIDFAEKETVGWLTVTKHPVKDLLCVTVSESLLTALPHVLGKVRRLFDLDCDPVAIFEALSPMNTLHPDLCVLGTRLPGCFDGFELAVRAVLGQQITVKAAKTLAGRLVMAYGAQVQTDSPALTHVFPSPSEITALGESIADHLGPLGITSARANTILALAQAFESGNIDFGFCQNPEAEMQKLMAIRGIGSWTAQYIAMRAMAWPDAFLETDAAIKKVLAPLSQKEMLKLAENWRPWRSYATMNLWNFIASEGDKNVLFG